MSSPFLKHLLRAPGARLQSAGELVSATLKRAGLGELGAVPEMPAGLMGRLLNRGRPVPAQAEDALAEGGRFGHGTYTLQAGTRPYRLFVPAAAGARPPLVVMLHGCTQTAEDFAAGTRMNAVAGRAGALVLYPVQVAGANPQRCWNWFNPADQARDGGEAALLAGMVREVMAAHGVDPRRVFVAGLSAGGAQAAILGAAFPDLFAAVGIHSGLACGAASDVMGALSAMRQGNAGRGRHSMRTIVFHGDRDHTVNPRNGELAAEQVSAGGSVRREEGQVPGGLRFTRWLERDAAGRVAVERWVVHGAGHAWSGGSAGGSYTEPAGPDASSEMLRFFLQG